MDQSSHPITAVAGQPAVVAHIIELRISDGSTPKRVDAFSTSTCQALRDAAAIKATETVDGRSVIDSGSYLRAVLAGAARRLNDKTFVLKPEDSVLQTIVGTDSNRVASLLKVASKPAAEPPDQAALSSVIAAPDLTEMLADAARLVPEVTPKQVRVDDRHALVACLKTLPGQQAIWTDGLTEEVTPSALFDRIRSALTDALDPSVNESSTAKEKPDEPSAWSSELAKIQPHRDLRIPKPERRSDTRYVRDDPARTLAEDRLGIATEVRALAEVMCLREPGPPLAIGLFGDWGSGKSTYMNLVEAAIDELTERASSDKAAQDLFVQGVVHIKFNAWHYNDADLWSSLTSEFFRQLRVGGHAERAVQDYSTLVQEVADRVAQSEKAADQEAVQLDQKRYTANELRKEIDQLDRDAETLRSRTLLDTAKSTIDGFSGKQEQVWDLLGLFGYDINKSDTVQAADALKLEADKALAAFGQISATSRGVLNALTGRGGKAAKEVYTVLAIGVFCVMLFLGLRALFPDILESGATVMLSLASLLAALSASVVRVHALVEPIFKTANSVALKLEAEERAAEEKRNAKAKELQDLEQEINKIEEKRETLLADAARFRGAGPEQVLDFFLRESETTRSFDAALGVVSRVRRAFEQLDAIFKEASNSSKSRPTGAHFDRIVLYIDDLDRCRAKQVVEVLEAVHLLLAFPLFIVVVGVDARWLEQSLLEYYKDKLSDTGPRDTHVEKAEGNGDKPVSEGQATVHDFLEKIFQVPVRLQRLSALPPDTYTGYIRQAAGSVRFEDDKGDDTDNGTQSEGRTAIEALKVSVKPVEYAAGAGAEQVRLKRAEVETIEKLGPIVGKTPRAVKRFVNIYRLMRGIRRGNDLDEFLGAKRASTPIVKPYAAYQFWLAADVGMPVEQVRQLRNVVNQFGSGDTADTLLDPVDPVDLPVDPGPNALPTLRQQPIKSPPPPYWEDLLAFWTSIPPSSRKVVYDAMKFIAEHLPGVDGVKALKLALEETKRFSSDRT